MSTFENVGLWKSAFPTKKDQWSKQREILKYALYGMREKAVILANEIPRNLPDYTDHSVEKHSDALWEIADLIAGPGYILTPIEAFVLGAAFLIHDLGMAIVAYPHGMQSIRKETAWKDTITDIIQKRENRVATKEDFYKTPREIEELALPIVLRNLHASQAKKLISTSWTTCDGMSGPYYLLENTDLRECLGPLIGSIAFSHWQSTVDLAEMFKEKLGSPASFPQSWTISALKLACLLRAADACHLDATRAPKFLRILRRPEGLSKNHWLFQSHLHQPTTNKSKDHLIYSTTYSFPKEEAESWWLCFDSLQIADRELKDIDNLLSNHDQPRFKITGIQGVSDPKSLTKFISTDEWYPVDVRIRATNVPELVQKLGGEELYGDDIRIPLRELIQNGADAISARRIIENRSSSWGSVTVSTGKDDFGLWIEVEDNGLGMSERVLSSVLLDFGSSYWGSHLMQEEFPGLLSKGFSSTGKFGIGFFSVFMWGSRIKITTRRPMDSEDSTSILEIKDLSSRPLIRKALPEEKMKDGGTSVRIWFTNDNYNIESLINDSSYNYSCRHLRALSRVSSVNLGNAGSHYNPFGMLLAELCPSLQTNLMLKIKNRRIRIIKANDWASIDGLLLLIRIMGCNIKEVNNLNFLITIAKNLRLIKRGNSIIGRICVFNDHISFLRGIFTIGGLASQSLFFKAGILLGRVTSIDRKSAEPIANGEEIGRWASEQAHLVKHITNESEELLQYASAINLFNGDIANLPIALTRNGALSKISLLHFASNKRKIRIIDYNTVRVHEPLRANEIITTMWRRTDTIHSIFNIILSSIANSWSTTIESIFLNNEIEPLSENNIHHFCNFFDVIRPTKPFGGKNKLKNGVEVGRST